MRSKTTRGFRERLNALPADVRQKARTNYKAFLADPYQSNLDFKRVAGRGATYSIRIGLYYRELAKLEETGDLVWYWVGSHADYDKLLSRG